MVEKGLNPVRIEIWRFGNLRLTFVKEIYLLTAKFPPAEIYGLTGQIRRAAVSIPSNIAEGQGRNSRKEFRQFLGIALGSVGGGRNSANHCQRNSVLKC